MRHFHCRIAETPGEFDEIARARSRAEEKGRLATSRFRVPREFDALDTLETSIHVLAMAGERAVGSATVLLPNPELARANNSRLGVPLERQYRVLQGPGLGVLVAEIHQLSLRKRWHGTRAALVLGAALLGVSHDWGVTHWLGAPGLETNSLEQASSIYHIAGAKGLLSRDWRVIPREPEALLAPSSSPGTLAAMRLPPALGLLCSRLGARIVGPPCRDSRVDRFSIPIIIDLDSIPARTLKLLAPLRRRWRARRARG
jgi:hypothetical protein